MLVVKDVIASNMFQGDISTSPVTSYHAQESVKNAAYSEGVVFTPEGIVRYTRFTESIWLMFIYGGLKYNIVEDAPYYDMAYHHHIATPKPELKEKGDFEALHEQTHFLSSIEALVKLFVDKVKQQHEVDDTPKIPFDYADKANAKLVYGLDGVIQPFKPE